MLSSYTQSFIQQNETLAAVNICRGHDYQMHVLYIVMQGNYRMLHPFSLVYCVIVKLSAIRIFSKMWKGFY